MKLRTALLPPAIALLLGTSFLGCKKDPKADPKNAMVSAAKLLADGQDFMNRGKWEDARKCFRQIEEYLPSSAEYPTAKLAMADSFFFQNTSSYPEAQVEYQSFLNYFPRHERRDYALYRVALCHYATIESAERDQTETRKALAAFQNLLREAPGSPYVVDAKAKTTQCWRRLAEHELIVGIQYVNNYHFPGAERRIKDLLETYPDYVDRERAYYYLGEAMRRKGLPFDVADQWQKAWMERNQKDDTQPMSKPEAEQLQKEFQAFKDEEEGKYRAEARSYYQKLVESYPTSEWAGRARDRLLEMGQAHVKEELDS